jgi:hypothetical protein
LFFNYEDDPVELDDLSGVDSEFEQYKNDLQAWLEVEARTTESAPEVEISTQEAERLRSLGYLE